MSLPDGRIELKEAHEWSGTYRGVSFSIRMSLNPGAKSRGLQERAFCAYIRGIIDQLHEMVPGLLVRHWHSGKFVTEAENQEQATS